MLKKVLIVALLGAWSSAATAQSVVALVFFDRHSANFDAAAEDVLAVFVTQARDGTAPVIVRGFADPEGGLPFNRAISLARAEHVAHRLRELGIASARLRIMARGQADFVLDSQESRRVELRLDR